MPVRYSIDQITDDMVLGEAISLPSGKMLLNAGFNISERYRQRLMELGYRTLLVHEAGTEDVNPQNLVSDHLTSELTSSMDDTQSNISNLISKFRDESSRELHKVIFEKRQDLNQFIMNTAMMRQVEALLNSLMNEPDIVLNLAAMKSAKNSYFLDSINVAVTSICLARKFNLSFDDIRNLGIGAMNYHIGMLVLPDEIIHKETPLNADEKKLYRNHTLYGYMMLSQNKRIAPTSAIVALQHHEYQNGSGYPTELKGTNRPPQRDISQTHVIHRFAEIVTVSDTYNTLLSAINTPQPADIKGVMEKMIRLSGEYINREIVRVLTNIIPILPVGTRVRITKAPDPQFTRYLGVVARDNPRNLARPEVLLYQTTTRQRLDPPIRINLEKHDQIEIEAII